MKDFHDIILSLRITGFECPPEEITKALGVQPAMTWQIGDPVSGLPDQYYGENGWLIDSGLSPDEDFAQHTDTLLGIIEPQLETFARVCSHYHTEFTGQVRMYYGLEVSTPWIHLDKRIMGILSIIGAEFSLDLQVHPADTQQ